KKVRLKVADLPVAEAVKELARVSGYSIQVAGFSKPPGKNVSLDVGEVSFWEALDKLCAQGGLMEQAHAASYQVGGGPIGPAPHGSVPPAELLFLAAPKNAQ